MSLPKELRELKKGDQVEAGTFMEALDDEPVVWVVETPYDLVSDTMVLDAYWLGVHLGRFRKGSKGLGVTRV